MKPCSLPAADQIDCGRRPLCYPGVTAVVAADMTEGVSPSRHPSSIVVVVTAPPFVICQVPTANTCGALRAHSQMMYEGFWTPFPCHTQTYQHYCLLLDVTYGWHLRMFLPLYCFFSSSFFSSPFCSDSDEDESEEEEPEPSLRSCAICN